MNVLVVGSGGREHALAWKLALSSEASQVFVAPGNDGIAMDTRIETVPISSDDFSGLLNFCHEKAIDFVVVGPDQALADGLVDRLDAEGILAFGPTKAAARLESSKAFAKQVMKDNAIPTAEFAVFDDFDKAAAFVESTDWAGFAVKADGLALGKGVVLCHSKRETIAALEDFMVKATMGTAGKRVVLEEFLEGREVSAFYLCDGTDYVCLGFACDYKQIRDGGKGPNTGGMGAFSPATWLPEGFREQVEREVVEPCLQGMRTTPFKGCLFIGLMATKQGPKVIEFNARFGDPETQALLPMVAEDLLPVLVATAKGELAKMEKDKLAIREGASVHVVKAAYGYPGTEGIAVRKGDTIAIPHAYTDGDNDDKIKLFFAGVKKQGGQFVTNGGRVLGVTAWGETQAAARAIAYQSIHEITFADAQMRSDIGEEDA